MEGKKLEMLLNYLKENGDSTSVKMVEILIEEQIFKIEPYKVNEGDIVARIKKQFNEFISSSKCLSRKEKEELITELNENDRDLRYSAKNFVEDCVSHTYWRWREKNDEFEKLWTEIAVQNASVNNEPYKVADETLKQYKAAFLLNQI